MAADETRSESGPGCVAVCAVCSSGEAQLGSGSQFPVQEKPNSRRHGPRPSQIPSVTGSTRFRVGCCFLKPA